MNLFNLKKDISKIIKIKKKTNNIKNSKIPLFSCGIIFISSIAILLQLFKGTSDIYALTFVFSIFLTSVAMLSVKHLLNHIQNKNIKLLKNTYLLNNNYNFIYQQNQIKEIEKDLSELSDDSKSLSFNFHKIYEDEDRALSDLIFSYLERLELKELLNNKKHILEFLKENPLKLKEEMQNKIFTKIIRGYKSLGIDFNILKEEIINDLNKYQKDLRSQKIILELIANELERLNDQKQKQNNLKKEVDFYRKRIEKLSDKKNIEIHLKNQDYQKTVINKI